jgi:hypothetical protein
MTHIGGFELVALAVACALKLDNLSTAPGERCTRCYYVERRPI